VVPTRFGKPVVRDEAGLVKELAATRARGYGVAIEEGEPGTCAMARAILGRDGIAVGTVSIAGPASRFTLERMKEVAPDLAATVNEIADLWPARHVMNFVSGNPLRKSSNA
jgi:IclR family transcriptional regulator, acetate operon repressor